MLAEMVAAGQLLQSTSGCPVDPMVIEPLNEVGHGSAGAAHHPGAISARVGRAPGVLRPTG